MCMCLRHEAVSGRQDPLLVDQGASTAMPVGDGIKRTGLKRERFINIHDYTPTHACRH